MIAILPSEGVRCENLKQIFLLGSSVQALGLRYRGKRRSEHPILLQLPAKEMCLASRLCGPGKGESNHSRPRFSRSPFRKPPTRLCWRYEAYSKAQIRGGKKWPASKRIFASVQLRAFCRLKYLRIFNKLMDILPTSLTCRG